MTFMLYEHIMTLFITLTIDSFFAYEISCRRKKGAAKAAPFLYNSLT